MNERFRFMEFNLESRLLAGRQILSPLSTYLIYHPSYIHLPLCLRYPYNLNTNMNYIAAYKLIKRRLTSRGGGGNDGSRISSDSNNTAINTILYEVELLIHVLELYNSITIRFVTTLNTDSIDNSGDGMNTSGVSNSSSDIEISYKKEAIEIKRILDLLRIDTYKVIKYKNGNWYDWNWFAKRKKNIEYDELMEQTISNYRICSNKMLNFIDKWLKFKNDINNKDLYIADDENREDITKSNKKNIINATSVFIIVFIFSLLFIFIIGNFNHCISYLYSMVFILVFNKNNQTNYSKETSNYLITTSTSIDNYSNEYELANKYYNDKKYTNSLEIFTVLGNSQHPGALNMLGKQYFFGLGVEVDHVIALDYWMQSSKLGFLNATYNAAMSYYNGTRIDLDTAFKLWEQCSNYGHVLCSTRLGECYYKGHGTEKDLFKACELWRFSSAKGDRDAYYHLGFNYFLGEGVDLNIKKSFELWSIASKMGHADATFQVAKSYFDGQGVEVNKNLAKEIWDRLSIEGHELAKQELSKIVPSADDKVDINLIKSKDDDIKEVKANNIKEVKDL